MSACCLLVLYEGITHCNWYVVILNGIGSVGRL